MSLCSGDKTLPFLHRSVDGIGRIAMHTIEGWYEYGIPLLDRQRHPLLDLEDVSGLGNIHTYDLLMGIVLPS